MGLVDLLVASSIPVLKVLLITALGSYLALERVNVLGEGARKQVNILVFFLFNPALVASNIAKTITFHSMVKLWFMPLNIFITFVVGSMLGWIVIQFIRPPSHLRGMVIGCCAAGNLGNMFLVMIPAVCEEKASPFGSPDACQSYGLAYVSLSMAIGAIYLWSYVYNIVRTYSAVGVKESKSLPAYKSSKMNSASEVESCTEPLLTLREFSASEDHKHQLAGTKSDEKVEMSLVGKLMQRAIMLIRHVNWKSLFVPSTVGAMVGFVIGLIPQIRKLMIGNDAPLHVIQDTASLLGDGAIPILTLILGGNLLKGLQGSDTQKSLIFSIIVVRYIALPLIGIFIVKGALGLGLIPPDPLYQFVLLLQFAVPPAMNLGTITQLFGAGESECSVIMLWAYSLASISLTLWSTFFMWIVA